MKVFAVHRYVIGLLLPSLAALQLVGSIAAASEFVNAQMDVALQNCISELASKNKWQNTDAVKEITCHGRGIKHLKGLTIYSQLEHLSLFNNALVSADLRSFKQLKTLNISNNQLRAIKLNNLSQLETLYLFKNKLTSIDFQGLVQLKKIRITNNQLINIDISPLVSLEKAYFFDNKLEDLSLKGLAKLNFIELRQNPMPDEVYDRYDSLAGITIIHDGNADDWQ